MTTYVGEAHFHTDNESERVEADNYLDAVEELAHQVFNFTPETEDGPYYLEDYRTFLDRASVVKSWSVTPKTPETTTGIGVARHVQINDEGEVFDIVTLTRGTEHWVLEKNDALKLVDRIRTVYSLR